MRYIKLFLSVFLISLAIISTLDLLSKVHTPPDEFLALFTLGATRKAELYFPGDRTDILQNTRISWYVGVYNHMGSVQLVKVVFKILNSSMLGPDSLNNTAAVRAPFYEEARLLLANETWVIPVSWSVLNATRTGNTTSIHSLVFNGETLRGNVEVQADRGYNFRIVLELWVYDERAGTYSFVWLGNGEEQHAAWNQLWFNMTRIALLPA